MRHFLLIPHLKIHNANAMSSPYTIGFPAIGINGFGMVKVCGRRREPRPAIGTIIFMLFYCIMYIVNCILFFSLNTNYCKLNSYLTPVLPNPA